MTDRTPRTGLTLEGDTPATAPASTSDAGQDRAAAVTAGRTDLPEVPSVDDEPSVRPPDSLPEYAVEALRNDLLTGRLRPGQHLTAKGIASRLGISHIPVREAFRYLEAQGHVTRDGRRGARVVPTSPEEARDIYLTRAALEAEANALGVPRLTAADDALLVRLIAQMEEAAAAGDLRAYRSHNRTFHFIAFERSDRPWVVRFLRNLWDAAARYQAPLFAGSAWKVDHPAHHRALLDALLSRDVDLVDRLMGEHRTWLLTSAGALPIDPDSAPRPAAGHQHHRQHPEEEPHDSG
jgi:DNA-binding GntR family transcriptional regulator